ncbi:MAG: galactokinase, partial [Chloroflexi bacterium HGW-Chloroflexi-1]
MPPFRLTMPANDLQQKILRAFEPRFGSPATFIVRAPGRINLIGEHTDYNDGFVLPMAIDRAVWIALRPRDDRRVVVHSLDFDEPCDFSLDDLRKGNGDWVEYVKGVAWAMMEAGHRLTGWEGVAAGDVPIGSGLSSSAAMELAAARAFAAASGLPWDPARMALIGQRAENGWVGVNCGIMDQLISAAGQADHALLIDCRSLASQAVPMPAGYRFLVLDSAAPRTLAGSAYNQRRAECESAVRALQAAYPGISALRDVTPAILAAEADRLDPVELKRARHVVTENDRVLRSVEALRGGQAAALGELMLASHASLRDDYQVSSAELDALVAIAREAPGVIGARMTGAGFGGCAVAMVEETAAAAA